MRKPMYQATASQRGLSFLNRRSRIAIACYNNRAFVEALESRQLLSGLGFIGSLPFDGTNGASPNSKPAIISTANGENIFGTTQGGGANGAGSIFEVVDSPHGGNPVIATVYSFTGGADGGDPHAGLMVDASGNLYGTTWTGGANGQGTIFKLTTSGGVFNFTTLASFSDTTAIDPSGLAIDSNGNLYGTTRNGGTSGDGFIFKLAAGASTITNLYSFTGGNDGAHPFGGLAINSGSLYGTTTAGGSGSSGTIFELPKGSATLTTLYAFTGLSDGASPRAGVYRDSSGNLFGETYMGGDFADGTIFELPAGSSTLVTLAAFSGANGASPTSGLAHDALGNLFGTTSGGGDNALGTVFELPAGSNTITSVYSFTGGDDGSSPAGIALDAATGAFYGAATSGGASGHGTVYKMEPPTHLVFDQQSALYQPPGSILAGATITPPITVDIEGNDGSTIKNDNSAVTLSILSGPTGAVLGGTVTVAAVNGVATFNDLSLSEDGTYTLQATDGTLASAPSASFTVGAPVVATQLAFVKQPLGVMAGENLQPITVAVEDAQGTPVSTDNSSVTLSILSGPAGATLPPGSTTVAAQNGVATFASLSLAVPGNYVLQATDGTLASATSVSFSISQSVVGTSLVFLQQPTATAAGGTMTPAVQVAVEDSNGSILTGDNSSVAISIASGPAGALFNGASTVPVQNGIATFSDLSFPVAGTYTFLAVNGFSKVVTSDTFTITNTIGSAAKLVFAQQPSDTTTGSTLATVTIDVEDANGSILTGDTSSVSLTIASGPGGAILGGTTTVAAVHGVATFSNVSLNTVGLYTLQAADGSLTPAASSSFVVSPSSPPSVGALEIWGGNTDLSGNPNALYNIDQNGYTQVGVTNAQNSAVTFSTGGIHYNYFVLVSRGRDQVDAVQGSDSTYLSSIPSTGSTSNNGSSMTGAPDGDYTAIGTQVDFNGTFAGYVEFANPGSWTGLTVYTGSMGVMLQGQVSHVSQYLPGVASPYDYHAELRVNDNGLITSGAVRNPSGVWYPLTLDTHSGDRNAQWSFNGDFGSLASLTAAFPNGTYTFQVNSVFGTTSTQFSYTMPALTPVISPIGLTDGATGVSTSKTIQWNAINYPNSTGGIDFEVDGPNSHNTIVSANGLATNTTSYGPLSLSPSSNYSLSIRLNFYPQSTNGDGFVFMSGTTNETDMLFRTAGTAASAPNINLTSVDFPAGTIHPGDWIGLPLAGGNSGGNAVGTSAGSVVPIQYEVVLAATKTWGAAGNIVVTQNPIGSGGFIGGESFSGKGDGPTVQIPASVTPGTYYVGLKVDSTGVVAGNTGNTTVWSATKITISALGTIIVTPPANQTATAGQSQSFALGTFTQSNANAPFSVDVNWGDASADTIFTMASAGTIPATLHTYAAGGNDTVTVTVSDQYGKVANKAAFSVAVPATATHFDVIAPTGATAGSAVSFTVKARDAYNNKVIGYSGTVHFTSSDPAAVLPADATLTAGAGTFSATFKTGGNQTVTATDTVTGSIVGVSSVVVVTPTAATRFEVIAPAGATAGNTVSFTVKARDAYNNKVTGYTGTVHFTSSDAAAILPADATLTNGVGTFGATLRMAGNQTLTATDTVTGSIVGVSGAVVVTPATATRFEVIVPATATAGSAVSLTVKARDAYNNKATGYTGTVHFTSSDAAAILPANATLTSGVGTFIATFKTASNQILTATDTVTGSIVGTSSVVTVTPGAATRFEVIVPATATAGNALSFTVKARDAYNNKVTGYTGTVHFTSSDAAAILPANATLTNGVGTFNATFKTASNQTVTATDTVAGAIVGTSTAVTVTPGAATHFEVIVPTTVTAGSALSLTVKARDAYNNKVTAYTGTVHFTSSDALAILPANAKLTNGVGIFSTTFKTAGSRTLTVTDTVAGSITGASSSVTVTPAAATHFEVIVPATATAGTALSITVKARDAYNNKVTGYTGTVHFTSSDALATLPANATLTNGAGTFSATLKTAGSRTLTATDNVTSSITGVSSAVTVAPGAVTHFEVIAPASATAGSVVSFTVKARDAYNNKVTGYTGTIHFTSSDALAILPANATLISGVGTFTATFKTAGSRTLAASDGTDTGSATLTVLT